MGIALLVWMLGLGLAGWALVRSLTRVSPPGAEGSSDDAPWPAARRLGSVVATLLGDRVQGKLMRDEEKLLKAGLSPMWQSEDLLGLQVAGAGAGLILALLVFPGHTFLAGSIGVGLGAWLPLRSVRKKRQERQLCIDCEFPTAMDLITLAVEGGMDFVAGMKLVTEQAKGTPVAKLFADVLQQINTGESRTEALRQLAESIDSVQIRTVIAALVQAIEHGSGVTETMRTQGDQLRYNRLMKAEKAAGEAPTKMLLPMMVCIMPCVMIMIFGPIVLSIIKSFASF